MSEFKKSNHTECEILQYKNLVSKEFEETYRNLLTKNKIPAFVQIVEIVLNNLGIDYYNKQNLDYFQSWYNDIFELSFLKKFIVSENYTELIIDSNGYLQLFGSEKEILKISLDQRRLQLAFETLAHLNHRQWNYSNSNVSFYTSLFNKKVRATLIHLSCTSNNVSKLFIRMHKTKPIPLTSFVEDKMKDKADKLSLFLESLIMEKENIIVTGSTGSGKTSLLRTLLNYVPQEQHLICIEDTLEIFLSSPYHTSLIANDQAGKSLKDYCAYALRMTPERLVLGEIRSHEIIPFLLNLNTGHKGIMATTHANSAHESIERLAMLYSLYSDKADINYKTIMGLLSKNIDYVVHMKNKKISQIIKLYNSNGENIHFDTIFSLE